MATLRESALKRFGPQVQKANARRSRDGVHVPALFKPPYGGGSYFGQNYHWEEILHYKYWAFVAIRAHINEIAGGDPPNLGDIIFADGRQRKRVRKALGGPRTQEEFRPYEHNHPLQRVFRNPNGPDVAFDLWAYHTLYKKLTGEAHWWVLRNAFGVPVEFWVIPTHWMRLATDRDGQPEGYNVQSPWGQSFFIPYAEVVSFYEQSPLNRYEGYAVGLAVGTWIDTYEAMTRMKLAMFKNSAVPAMHIMLGEAYNDPDEEFLARYYAKLNARFQGENRSGQTIVTGADVEVKGVEGHRPTDALQATISSEEQIRDMVLAAYGVPKGVVGLEPVSDVSAYAPQRQFCRFTINPELTYMAQVITEKIVKTTPGCEDGICFWDDRVADDVELEERKIAADLATGVRTVNEVRTFRGLETYPNGGDDPIINGQVMPWVKPDEDDSKLAQAFDKAVSEGEPDVPANDPTATNELRSTVGGASALMQLQGQYYRGEIPKDAAVSTAVLLFGFPENEAVELFPGEPQPQQPGTPPVSMSLNSSSGAAGGFTEKCREGPNAGKPGPCPKPRDGASGGKRKPASKPEPTANALLDVRVTPEDVKRMFGDAKPKLNPVKLPDGYKPKAIPPQTSVVVKSSGKASRPGKMGVLDHAEFVSKLPEAQLLALQEYTDDGYTELNNKARKCPPKFGCLKGDVKQKVALIEQAIQSAGRLSKPIEVYRGILMPKAKVAKFVEALQAAKDNGAEYNMPSVTSTAMKRGGWFEDPGDKDYNSVGFVIKAKSGLAIESVSVHQGESEFLQSAFAKYKVKSVKRVGTRIDVTLEEI